MFSNSWNQKDKPEDSDDTYVLMIVYQLHLSTYLY